MFKALANLFGIRSADAAAQSPAVAPPDMGQITEVLDPGAPYSHGTAVPRWPEQGAALVAATPESLLDTQRDLIRQIKQNSPLTPAEFDDLIMPVFLNYVRWVHLLPASETNHHFGPGGLLAHGFEVAMHAGRIAAGKQVGRDLNPSDRTKYQPRWAIATMLGGLFHDIGKPLVDCGAKCVHSQLNWPSMDTSLYDWLLANKLTHYQIYWKPGQRHERHKAVGTAVVREILGPRVLAWLAEECTHSVTSSMLVSIAQGKVPNNEMSAIVSRADSMSVEADLKRLAEKQQASGQGGLKSVAALFMAELRKQIESNKLQINKPGGELWCTSVGVFGTDPSILDTAHQELAAKQIAGLPPQKRDMFVALHDNGFIDICEDEESNESSYTWDLIVETVHKDQVHVSPTFRAVKFLKPEFLFGDMPLPTLVNATCKAPFVTAEDARNIVAAVKIADAPQSVESALGQAADAIAAQSAAEPVAAPASAPEQAVQAPSDDGTGAAQGQDRRNRRDHASSRSVEDTRRRDRDGNQDSAAWFLTTLEGKDFVGPAMAQIIRKIASRKLQWDVDAFQMSDGLVIRYPQGLERLGIPPGDLLPLIVEKKWLAQDAGSDRPVTDRTFPNGQRHKCIILTGMVLKTWEAVRNEYPQIMSGTAVDLVGDDSMGEAPAPRQAAPVKAAEPAPRRDPPAQPRNEQRPAQQRPQASPQQRPQERPAEGAPKDNHRPAGNPRPQQSGPAPKPAAAPTSNHQAPTRPPKEQRPAVGAAPAAHRGHDGPGKPMSFADNGGGARSASGTPTAKPEKSYPRSMADLACHKISDVTPQKAEWINGIVMRVIGLKLHKDGIDAYDPSQPDAATIKSILASFQTSNSEIRAAPFLAALSTPDNPLFIFKQPDTPRVEDIGNDIKRNPDYQIPDWVFTPPGKANLLKPVDGANAKAS